MKVDEKKCLEYVTKALAKQNNAEIVFENVGDINLLLRLLKTVIPNPQATEFPDFVSDYAIVEHFSITSSKENRKGSIFKILQNNNNKETEKRTEEWNRSCLDQLFENNTIRSTVIRNIYNDFSYENFMESLERNLSHHINSLNKYDVKNRNTIFLIELQDAPMRVFEDGKFKQFYHLHTDRKALEILKQYKELLNVIIFRSSDRIELIDMEKYDIVLNCSNYQKDIRGGRLIENKVLTSIKI